MGIKSQGGDSNSSYMSELTDTSDAAGVMYGDTDIVGPFGSYPSKPLLILTTPDPGKVIGKFEYRYFVKDEAIDDIENYSGIESRQLESYGYPRKVVLTFDKTAANASATNTIGNLLHEYQGFTTPGSSDLFSSETFKNLTSEPAIQSDGWIYFSPHPKDVEKIVASAAGGTGVSARSAWMEMASNPQSQNQDFLKEAMAKAPNTGVVFLNPSTGLPSVEAADSRPDNACRNLVFKSYCYDVFAKSGNDPGNIHMAELQENLAATKQYQTEHRAKSKPLELNTDEFTIKSATIDDYLSNSSEEGIGIIGMIIFKWEVSYVDGKQVRTPKNTIIVPNLDTNEISDPRVKYGASYEYSAHLLCVLRFQAGATYQNVLFVGSEGRKITIKCVEKIPPPTVPYIKFFWNGRSIDLSWAMPMQSNDKGGPIGDVKGYQIFYRHLINEPFKLFKVIDFNDALVKYKSPESFPQSIVEKYDYPYHRASFVPIPDKEYIFAICAIDAHGNTSNYSGQYSVKYVSYKNELEISMASRPGAPKQYPNFLMAKKMFLDSIGVSNKKKLRIVYNPDFIDLNIYGDIQQMVYESSKNNNETLPAYNVQLIDLESQKDERIKILVRKE